MNNIIVIAIFAIIVIAVIAGRFFELTEGSKFKQSSNQTPRKMPEPEVPQEKTAEEKSPSPQAKRIVDHIMMNGSSIAIEQEGDAIIFVIDGTKYSDPATIPDKTLRKRAQAFIKMRGFIKRFTQKP